MNVDKTVSLLMTSGGQVSSVWESHADAQARADSFNADPWWSPGEPDQDAPYSVVIWLVREAKQ